MRKLPPQPCRVRPIVVDPEAVCLDAQLLALALDHYVKPGPAVKAMVGVGYGIEQASAAMAPATLELARGRARTLCCKSHRLDTEGEAT